MKHLNNFIIIRFRNESSERRIWHLAIISIVKPGIFDTWTVNVYRS